MADTHEIREKIIIEVQEKLAKATEKAKALESALKALTSASSKQANVVKENNRAWDEHYRRLAKQLDIKRRVAESYKYADAAAQYYNRTLRKQRLEQEKLAKRLKLHASGLLKAAKSEKLTGEQALILKDKLRRLTNQVNKLDRAGSDVRSLRRNLLKAKYTLGEFSRKTKEATSHTKKFIGWWKRFGQVAVGFTLAYRAINLIEDGIRSLFDTIREGVELSGELGTIQAKMALWGTIFPSNAKSFSDAMSKASVNVAAFRRELPDALSTVQDLTQGMDELAQHGVFATEKNMHKIVQFIDLTAMVAKASGSTVNQVRQEFQALFEGNVRAGNTLLMLLRNIGVNTSKLRAQLKAGVNVSENFDRIVEILTGHVDELKESIWKRDPTSAFQRWHKELLLIISDSIDLGSRATGSFNVFADILTKHANRLKANKNLTLAWSKAMQNLADGLDQVLYTGEDWFSGLANWLARINFEKAIEGFRNLTSTFNKLATSVISNMPPLVEALEMLSNSIKKINDAIPSAVMGGVWKGVILRWLFGSTPIGVATAAVVTMVAMIKDLYKSWEQKSPKPLEKWVPDFIKKKVEQYRSAMGYRPPPAKFVPIYTPDGVVWVNENDVDQFLSKKEVGLHGRETTKVIDPIVKLKDKIDLLSNSFRYNKAIIGNNKVALQELASAYKTNVQSILRKYSDLLGTPGGKALKQKLINLKIEIARILSTKGYKKDIWRAFTDGLKDHIYTAKTMFDDLKNNVSNNLKSMEDAFVKFATTGKGSWKEMLSSMATEWLRFAYRLLASKIFQLVASNVMSYYSTSSAPKDTGFYEQRYNTFNTAPNRSGAWAMHNGGVVGYDKPTSVKLVNPEIFTNAPRLHDGLQADEFPAILQRGEVVIPKDRTSGPNVIVNVINQTNTQAKTRQDGPRWDGKQWVVDIMLDAVNRRSDVRHAFGIA